MKRPSRSSTIVMNRIYSYLVKRLSSRDLADEVFQNVFAKLHKSRELYDSKHIFAKWIYTISKSELIDCYRKNARSIQASDLNPDDLCSPEPQNIDVSPYTDHKNLNEMEKQALQLRYMDDQDFSEISRILETGEANSRKIISRALKKLRSFYGGHHEK